MRVAVWAPPGEAPYPRARAREDDLVARERLHAVREGPLEGEAEKRRHVARGELRDGALVERLDREVVGKGDGSRRIRDRERRVTRQVEAGREADVVGILIPLREPIGRID